MENKPEPIFPDGLFFSRPRDGAPDFIKGALSIEPKKLFAFMDKNRNLLSQKGWMNLDLKLSKTGTLYFQVNTYKADMVKPEALKEKSNLSEIEIAQLRALRGDNKDEINVEEVANEWANTPF